MANRGYAARRARWEAADRRQFDDAAVDKIADWLLTLNEQQLDDLLTRVLDFIQQQQSGLASPSVDSTRPKETTMSLEQALADNTAAVKALTEALAKGAPAASGKGTSSTKATTTATASPPPPPPKAKYTREEMAGALSEVKEKFDDKAKTAKAIIKDVGGVDKMADIPDDKIDAVYEAAKAKMEEGGAGEGGDL